MPEHAMFKLRVAAIIPAAGTGSRMGGNIAKQFLELSSRPILLHTLTVFENWSGVEQVIAVVPEQEQERLREWVARHRLNKVCKIVSGGSRRQDSVFNGFREVNQETDIVLVHDGVRPLVTPQILESCAREAAYTGAAIAAVPVKDTIKEIGRDRKVIRTLERSRLRAVQTPQCFRRNVLGKALEQAALDSFTGTDEASLVERLGIPVTFIEGSYENIKITTPEDLFIAERILKTRKSWSDFTSPR